MRQVNDAQGNFQRCEILVINLGPTSVTQSDIYVFGDVWWQLFYGQFSYVNPYSPGDFSNKDYPSILIYK